MGLYTQQDPIGIAGGLNLYGYANGDPVNRSDPFGLCPNCGLNNWHLERVEEFGDEVLDDEAARRRMEAGLETTSTDPQGYQLETGGTQYRDGTYVPGTPVNRELVNLHTFLGRPIDYDWHAHPNVGMSVPDRPGDLYIFGVSGGDLAAMGANALHARSTPGQGAPFPSYVVDDFFFYKLTVGSAAPQVWARFRGVGR